ncbi:unnamed protein product [Symbiodinium natans]|uniref:Uncharacterized protein n=1 Tax=Symbiodinium natans TaxID=878477 RepID=A0A812L938_9DINO|nr:unnamed protein product [Symbiodinium natans]
MADNSQLGHVSKTQRTRFIGLSGESCDFVESFAPRMSIKDLRARAAASRGVKAARLRFFRTSSCAALGDEDEVTYEVRQVDGRVEFCSTGEPLQMVLMPTVQTTFSGPVKCQLEHRGEYESYQACRWEGDWVTVTMEQRDLGPSMNDELHIFIGDVDLVRYGGLKDPHHRQLENWGNKDAGALELTVCQERSGPQTDLPGRYQIAERLNHSQHSIVFASSDCSEGRGTLRLGDSVDVLEVRGPGVARGRYKEFVVGRIHFKGADGWIPLVEGMKFYAKRCEEEALYKLVLSRHYSVERGDAMYRIFDTSELWFADVKERDEFVAAFRSWECANPQPPLWTRGGQR